MSLLDRSSSEIKRERVRSIRFLTRDEPIVGTDHTPNTDICVFTYRFETLVPIKNYPRRYLQRIIHGKSSENIIPYVLCTVREKLGITRRYTGENAVDSVARPILGDLEPQSSIAGNADDDRRRISR